MAVFERIDLELVRGILASASGAGDELAAVSFTNQVVGSGSVPDARIAARFSWWFETKTTANCYVREGHDRDQVRAHAQMLDDAESLLFVLTPDPVRPAWFDILDGVAEDRRARIWWIGFRDMADAMERLVGDPRRTVGEQTRFLLSELVALYETDGLLSFDDTVIVAARHAWPEYLHRGVYACQANRSFKTGLKYFGFYAEAAIQPLIASLRRHVVAVPLNAEESARLRKIGDAEVADVIDALIADGTRLSDTLYDVILLSAPDSPDTVRLAEPILADTKTASGRNWGWTLGQRYTSLRALTSGVTRTSQLDALSR